MLILEVTLWLAGILVVVITLVPLSQSPRWWVRVCDFPRFQVCVVAIAVLAIFPMIAWPLSALDAVLLIGVSLAALWQLSWVWRYFPISPLEVSQAKPSRSASQLTLLTTNVYQNSRYAEGLLNIIRAASPDVVLAVETDEWWCSRLKDGLASGYPHTLTHALSNGYGLALISRLELVEPSIRFLIDEAIPSIKTGIRLRSGAVVDLFGMHPQPPAPPQQDSTERDAELVFVGHEIKRSQRPAIVLGDLNDVAWSPTTSRFKVAGELLDPRRGRGFYNTYPAGMPSFRYPLDYIFHTRHFAVCDMKVLGRFLSDHLPLCVTLDLEGE